VIGVEFEVPVGHWLPRQSSPDWRRRKRPSSKSIKLKGSNKNCSLV
jgi:hypothetical protein